MGGLADGADNGMEWTSVEVGAEGGLAEGGEEWEGFRSRRREREL